MAWSVDKSANSTFVPNSTMTPCVPCLYNFCPICAAVLNSISLLGLPLEGWAVWLLASSPITEKTDLISFNLLLSDSLLHLTNLLNMSGIVLFHQTSEYMWGFLLCLVAFGRPMFSCFMCVERYMAVEHPIVFLKYRPLRYRIAILVVAWMSLLLIYFVSAALCATPGDHVHQFLLFKCSVLILIIGINSFCSVSVLRALVRPPPGDGRRDGRGEGQTKKSLIDQMKKKAFLVVTMGLFYVVICYLPLVVLIFSYSVFEESQFCIGYVVNLCFVLQISCIFGLCKLHNMGKLSGINCVRKRLLLNNVWSANNKKHIQSADN